MVLSNSAVINITWYVAVLLERIHSLILPKLILFAKYKSMPETLV